MSGSCKIIPFVRNQIFGVLYIPKHVALLLEISLFPPDLQDLLFNGVSLQADISCSLASLFKSVFVDVHPFCVIVAMLFLGTGSKTLYSKCIF